MRIKKCLSSIVFISIYSHSLPNQKSYRMDKLYHATPSFILNSTIRNNNNIINMNID